MKKYEIKFTKSAKKEFRKLNKDVRSKVLEALNFLSLNPYTELLDIKKLKHQDELFRVRIGRHRLVYTIENKLLIVTIIKIGHRKDMYRKF